MIGIITENGSDQHITPYARKRHTLAHRARLSLASQTPLRMRAVLRLANRRASLALGIAIVVGSALGAAAAATSVLALHAVRHLELQANVAPLAPAPSPPSPPVIAPVKRHRLLPAFHINPLAGLASWYGSVWNGRKTASGETFDEEELTAAHKSLPLGTVVRVTNLRSMRSVIVRINDRGALAPDRVIDLSSAAAREIGMVEQGLARVKLEVLGRS